MRETDSENRWVVRLPVRFNEVDAAGIVYFPRFFDYFHLAFEDFFGATTGVPYHVWIKERRIGWPTVHIESDFRAPLRYGDLFEVAVSFPKIGRSSFVARYEASMAGRLCCSTEITVVTTDIDRMVPLEIPALVREAISRFPGA